MISHAAIGLRLRPITTVVVGVAFANYGILLIRNIEEMAAFDLRK